MNGTKSAPQVPAAVTRQLAEWLASVRLDDVPVQVRDRARHVLLDGVGCGLLGARLPWSEAATEAICSLEAGGACVLIGTGRTTSPSAAALLNSSYIQGFELDDYHPSAPVHSASLVLPAMLAATNAEGRTGADLLLGAIRGFEVGPRVGLALHGGRCSPAAGIPVQCSEVPRRLRRPGRCTVWTPGASRTPSGLRPRRRVG